MLYPDAQRLHTHKHTNDEPFPKSSEHAQGPAQPTSAPSIRDDTAVLAQSPTYHLPPQCPHLDLPPEAPAPPHARGPAQRPPAEPETTAPEAEQSDLKGARVVAPACPMRNTRGAGGWTDSLRGFSLVQSVAWHGMRAAETGWINRRHLAGTREAGEGEGRRGGGGCGTGGGPLTGGTWYGVGSGRSVERRGVGRDAGSLYRGEIWAVDWREL